GNQPAWDILLGRSTVACQLPGKFKHQTFDGQRGKFICPTKLRVDPHREPNQGAMLESTGPGKSSRRLKSPEPLIIGLDNKASHLVRSDLVGMDLLCGAEV